MPKTVRFVWKKTCSTCRTARSFLLEQGVKFEEDRELNSAPLTVAELEALIGTRDHKEFLNTRNELYRERQMKKDPPARAQALKLMAEHPNLIRRPVLVVGGKILLGFDAKSWKETLS